MTTPIAESEQARIFACLEGVSHAGLAVSGGADSMALMHLARRWQMAGGKSAPRFTVLNVDHALRLESAEEARWVASQVRTLGLEVAVLNWEAAQITSGVQERARQARYSLMAGFAHANGLDALVTAHHLDDQAETLLMRLGRGSGIDGLAGIPQMGQWAGLKVVRPFLELSKARLVATLRTLNATWLEDPSNDDTRFERVRIRRAMDQLARLGIGAEALARSAARLRRASEALEATANEFLSQSASVSDAGYGQISAQAMLSVAEDVALRAIARMIQRIGGQIGPPRLVKLESLVEAVRRGDDTPRTLGGCRVEPGNKDIFILREQGRAGLAHMTLKPGECGLWDNRFRVSLDVTCKAPVEVRALGERAYGEVRARLGTPVTLPERAVDGLVSFWRDETVICAPTIGYFAESESGRGYAAQFVN